MTYKPRHGCRIEVPKLGAEVGPTADSVIIEPKIITSKWTRNSHMLADTLTLTLGWDDSGVDPRTLKHARCLFWLWDSNAEDFDEVKHLRFVGICKTAKRSGSEDEVHVELTFDDFTTLLIESRGYPATGIPEWSDTLQQVWDRICDNTGFYDLDQKRIVSSVAALKDRLVFRLSDPELARRTLGAAVPQRFHAIGKPSPPRNATSWAVWQWCVNSIGLISYIDKDQCIVTDSPSLFRETDAPSAIWGRDILTIEEESNADTACKGILLKSMDPLSGRVIEAFYPPIGDARILTKRPTAGKAAKAPTETDLANAHYEAFNYFEIIDEAILAERARTVYDEYSRQDLTGTFTTAEMALEAPSGDRMSLFDIAPGDAIAVHFRDVDPSFLAGLANDDERHLHLLDRGYSEDMAAVILQNSAGMLKLKPIFNAKTLTTELGPSSFRAEVKYWNRIRLE